ncbi:hypothetical protein FHG87_006802 [Trinorchestia longiramus]|nr:hypothetical protein FHG87_006802 [Trinorchestia longiramus]
MASAKIKARTNIKFMVKLGWKNSQIIDSLEQVYGDNASKKSATYRWISRFRSGRNETKDDLRSGRPCTSVCVENIDAVCDLIEKDRQITTESVADTLSISVGSAHTILVDSLGLSKLSAQWVPRLLHPDQQESRAGLSMEILNKSKLVPLYAVTCPPSLVLQDGEAVMVWLCLLRCCCYCCCYHEKSSDNLNNLKCSTNKSSSFGQSISKLLLVFLLVTIIVFPPATSSSIRSPAFCDGIGGHTSEEVHQLLYTDDGREPITIVAADWPGQQLLSEVVAVLLHQMMGYKDVEVFTCNEPYSANESSVLFVSPLYRK